ncbi:hypothetical protein N7G274_002415 [Stereocaulon virgatum]|uniref:Zn(2)-C6 fungal-type domain-containing protein n=1 Tax=Stereocaulon virgatum TaxID=373712 RepID=A0ABR4AL13_9LECA
MAMATLSTAAATDKTLSACDQCRTRKLKCSGDLVSCSRCTAEGVVCHYSQRKTMGRPRKRRREEEGDLYDGRASQDRLQDRAHDLGGHASQDGYFAGIFGDDLANNDYSYFGNGLEANGFEDGNFDLQLLQEPGSDTTFELPAWEHLQDLSTYNSTSSGNFSQLRKHKAPTTISPISADRAPTEGSIPICSCLPKLYAVLASFQSTPAPSFPYSMATLKKANCLGHEIVTCRVCPQAYNTAVQNSMLLGTLLQIVIYEYSKLLKQIDERSTLTDKIPFRVGEPSLEFDSRHTGTPDCPMAVNIELSGEDWRMIARKAIRQEVLGSTGSNDGLEGLVDAMRNRQITWHERYKSELHVAHHDHNTGASMENDGKANKICLQVAFINQLKKSLEMLNL